MLEPCISPTWVTCCFRPRSSEDNADEHFRQQALVCSLTRARGRRGEVLLPHVPVQIAERLLRPGRRAFLARAFRLARQRCGGGGLVHPSREELDNAMALAHGPAIGDDEELLDQDAVDDDWQPWPDCSIPNGELVRTWVKCQPCHVLLVLAEAHGSF